jgi:hypothetical protein
MKTLLSVDWDYFVPERPEYDLSHSESPIFLDMVWRSRSGLLDHIKTTGTEEGFWDRLGGSMDGVGPTYVSDSHMYAYRLLLSGVDHVILVDAHHDCWKEGRKDHVYCHNWLRVWLAGGKHRRVTWIQPEWSKGIFEVPKDLRKLVATESEIKGKIDMVHVCRSGCWTPPWLDKQFIQFVDSRKSLKINMQGELPWNPMAERWTEADLKELRDRDDRIQDAIRGIKTGVMSSSSFLGARVELAASA